MNLNTASDLSEGSTEIAVPYLDLPATCTLVVPEVDDPHPVIYISVTPPVIYVVSKHEDVDSQGVKTYRQKLHGLYGYAAGNSWQPCHPRFQLRLKIRFRIGSPRSPSKTWAGADPFGKWERQDLGRWG